MSPTPKDKAHRQLVAAARMKVVTGAVWDATKSRGKGTQRTENGQRLVITEEPELVVLNPETGTVALKVTVRLHDAETDVEIPVGTHRYIVNPPTEHDGQVDPVGALWSVLWDIVRTTPDVEGWRP